MFSMVSSIAETIYFPCPTLPTLSPCLSLLLPSLTLTQRRALSRSLPSKPPAAIKLHLNADPLITNLRSIQCGADRFSCPDAGARNRTTPRRLSASCGRELSRAISHLWTNSASTKGRLSHVSEKWERVSVYLKYGAGTSRDCSIVSLTGN